jgi:predicted Co/Zn/Cd cation transporter (cation efflux family)
MKHVLLLSMRLLLLVIALYAMSNALKELLLREDELLNAVLLILINVLIAISCWALGCWRPARPAPHGEQGGQGAKT